MSVKQSLIDNEEFIKSKVPVGFHGDLKKQIDDLEEPKKLSDDEENAAILKDLPVEFHASFKENPGAHKPTPVPAKEELLKQAKENLPEEFHEGLEKNWK